jgi:hypothetical protein
LNTFYCYGSSDSGRLFGFSRIGGGLFQRIGKKKLTDIGFSVLVFPFGIGLVWFFGRWTCWLFLQDIGLIDYLPINFCYKTKVT